jgi:hypothetical protein
MKKLALFPMIWLLLAATAAGQDRSEDRSVVPKSSTIAGRVGQDGKTLTGKRGESWLVANPAMLAGREGQLVKVKCQLFPGGGHEIHVLSVKTMATQTKYGVNLGDAAFRR